MGKNSEIEILEKRRRKGRRALIITNIYFCTTLFAYSVVAWVILQTILQSEKDLDYLSFFFFLSLAGIGVYYSIRGLICLCQPSIDRMDVELYHGVTLWLSFGIGALILAGGLLLIASDCMVDGLSNLTSFLYFLLEVESPFVLVCFLGFFCRRFIQQDLEKFERGGWGRRGSQETPEKNAKNEKSTKNDLTDQEEIKEEVSLTAGMSTEATEVATEGSYTKAPACVPE